MRVISSELMEKKFQQITDNFITNTLFILRHSRAVVNKYAPYSIIVRHDGVTLKLSFVIPAKAGIQGRLFMG